MPISVSIPAGVKTIDQIIVQDTCDFPQGHCFGSDGGTGIPLKDKVLKGRGGDQEVWKLSADKSQILAKQQYFKCQYCQKYVYSGEI